MLSADTNAKDTAGSNTYQTPPAAQQTSQNDWITERFKAWETFDYDADDVLLLDRAEYIRCGMPIVVSVDALFQEKESTGPIACYQSDPRAFRSYIKDPSFLQSFEVSSHNALIR